MIVSPSPGSTPRVRGKVKSCSASCIVMRSRTMVLKRLTIFGFSIPSGGSSIVPHWTYGPKRPFLAKTGRPSNSPMGSSLLGIARRRNAISRVNSSGARESGTEAFSSPRFTYGPYFPGLTTMTSPVVGSAPMVNELIVTGSMPAMFCSINRLRPSSMASPSRPSSIRPK